MVLLVEDMYIWTTRGDLIWARPYDPIQKLVVGLSHEAVSTGSKRKEGGHSSKARGPSVQWTPGLGFREARIQRRPQV